MEPLVKLPAQSVAATPSPYLLAQVQSADNLPCFANPTPALLTDAGGTVGNYCATFPESAYSSMEFRNIWQFHISVPGIGQQPAYCLDKGKGGPVGSGHPFRSIPVEQAYPTLSALQKGQLAWILQHAYPAVAAAELFRQSGVDAAATPSLDSNDAYAATQISIWSVFNPPHPLSWSFLACDTSSPHPKSARLAATVSWLYERSLTAARELEQPLPCIQPGCRSVTLPGVACLENCGRQQLIAVGNTWLYGPLRLTSRLPYTLLLEPCCDEGGAPTAPPTLVDASRAPLAAPVNGEPFYIRFPADVRANCYQLVLEVAHSRLCALILESLENPADIQKLGATLLIGNPTHTEASLRFCCYAPTECPDCPQCPACPPCPEPGDCPDCPDCPICPAPPECPARPDCPTPPRPPHSCCCWSAAQSGALKFCLRCWKAPRRCQESNRFLLRFLR